MDQNPCLGPDSATAYRGETIRRIAFVGSSTAMGGVEWSTLFLADGLRRHGWEPVVICPCEGELPEACRCRGISVRILRRGPMLATSIRIGRSRRLPNPLAWAWDLVISLYASLNLSRYLASARPDMVITKGMFSHLYGGLAARVVGVPCVWHAQDYVSERSWGLYRVGFSTLSRFLPTHIVADGTPIACQLPSRVRKHVSVVFNGVDTDLFHPDRDGSGIRRQLGIPDDACVIGHVARITPWKGQHYLIEAFSSIAAAHPDVYLVFVGSPVFDNDAYECLLKRAAQQSGFQDRILFAGYRKDLPDVLAGMDVFVHTSVEKDTSPLALSSAMASGLPVVAFDIEGVREVIGGSENGILVPVAGVAELSEALDRLVRDEAERQRMARGARRRAMEALRLDDYVSRMDAVFRMVAQSSKAVASSVSTAP